MSEAKAEGQAVPSASLWQTFRESFSWLSLLTLALSVAVMARIIGWPIAAGVLLGIAWHEFGHAVAARRIGAVVKPMVFLPYIGGILRLSGPRMSRAHEAYVAMVGPLFGLIMAHAFFVAGKLLGMPSLVGISFFQALVNLFNLVPIHPLDGGRVLKSLSFSVHQALGYSVILLSIACAFVVAATIKAPSLYLVAFMGVFELLAEWEWAKAARVARVAREMIARLPAEHQAHLSSQLDKAIGPAGGQKMTWTEIGGIVLAYVLFTSALLFIAWAGLNTEGVMPWLEKVLA